MTRIAITSNDNDVVLGTGRRFHQFGVGLFRQNGKEEREKKSQADKHVRMSERLREESARDAKHLLAAIYWEGERKGHLEYFVDQWYT